MSPDQTAMTAEVVMLAALFSIGGYAIWIQSVNATVPNWCSLALLGTGLTGHAVMTHAGVTSIGYSLGLVAIALAVSMVLYGLGVWGPGDGKLYWAVVVALPPTLLRSRDLISTNSNWASVLANAFVCYLAVVVGRRLRRAWVSGEASVDTDRWLMSLVRTATMLGLALGFSALALNEPLSHVVAFGTSLLGAQAINRFLPRHHQLMLAIPGMTVLAYLTMVTGPWLSHLLVWFGAWWADGLLLWLLADKAEPGYALGSSSLTASIVVGAGIAAVLDGSLIQRVGRLAATLL